KPPDPPFIDRIREILPAPGHALEPRWILTLEVQVEDARRAIGLVDVVCPEEHLPLGRIPSPNFRELRSPVRGPCRTDTFENEKRGAPEGEPALHHGPTSAAGLPVRASPRARGTAAAAAQRPCAASHAASTACWAAKAGG